MKLSDFAKLWSYLRKFERKRFLSNRVSTRGIYNLEDKILGTNVSTTLVNYVTRGLKVMIIFSAISRVGIVWSRFIVKLKKRVKLFFSCFIGKKIHWITSDNLLVMLNRGGYFAI